MQIACLGWGSLVWDPRSLPIGSVWLCDGPLLPVEFARQSSDGRITIVIASVPDRVQALWSLLALTDLDRATRALARREEIREASERKIGYWAPERNSGHREADVIGEWASRKGLDAVVWTALEPGFLGQRGSLPTEDEIVNYLRNMPSQCRPASEEYIRNAPAQIDTRYRTRIAKELGWSPSALAFSKCVPPTRST